MSNEQRPQGSMAVPPELAAQFKAQMEAQVVQEKVKAEINAILEANKCTIQVSVTFHSDLGMQAGWRVVAVPKGG